MAFNSAELVQASLNGDLAEVRRLVDAGADVNSKDVHGMGPLLTFTPAVTEFLLARGADPNKQSNESGTPVLIGVAYMNHAECVRLLLEAGADPNRSAGDSGETALHAALAKPAAEVPEQQQVVDLLLKHGADPNRPTVPGVRTDGFWRDVRTRGETPLHRAAAYASEETIQLLLAAGGDKTLRDANGDSPQSWASWHWRPRRICVDLLSPKTPNATAGQ